MEQEALLSETMKITRLLDTKSELLASLIEQAETLVVSIRQFGSFGKWLRANFPTDDLENFGIFLDRIPCDGLLQDTPYLFVNTGTTRLHGTLNQQVTATFVGAWIVNADQATIHASQDVQIHVLDSLHDINHTTEYRLTDQERELRNALLHRLRQSGIEVIDDVEEGQRVLDGANESAKIQAKKKLLDTAPLIQEEGSPADISSSHGANILRNLDKLASLLDNVSSWRKSILSDIADALGAKSKGSASRYATFRTKNGQDVTIRLGSHNANTASFDNNNESNGISIVISNRANKGIKNFGNAHLVEFFYPEIALRRADGKPLADITRAIKQALYSGEFNDPTGIAERQEVNADTRFFSTPSGDTYGFILNGKIYIDPRIATAETPIHEYAHLWASLMRSENRAEWLHIVSLLKETPIWNKVKERYPHLWTDNEIAEEAVAQYSGRRGAERLRMELSKSGHVSAAILCVKEILSKFWKEVAKLFKIHFTTAEEVADRVLFDLLEGVNPYAELKHIQQNPEQDRCISRDQDGVLHHQHFF